MLATGSLEILSPVCSLSWLRMGLDAFAHSFMSTLSQRQLPEVTSSSLLQLSSTEITTLVKPLKLNRHLLGQLRDTERLSGSLQSIGKDSHNHTEFHWHTVKCPKHNQVMNKVADNYRMNQRIS